MRLIDTPICDLYVVEPKVFEDSRGCFFESYNLQKFTDMGIANQFVQDNQSYSKYGTIRGLHYQLAPFAQAKLVRVLQGSILDVAVDIRKNSPTFGKVFSCELNDMNKHMLFVPRGFAHGFSVLSPNATVMYKCDSFYRADAERGIRYNDADLSIDWKVDVNEAIVSAKDNVLPLFNDIECNFVFGGDY